MQGESSLQELSLCGLDQHVLGMHDFERVHEAGAWGNHQAADSLAADQAFAIDSQDPAREARLRNAQRLFSLKSDSSIFSGMSAPAGSEELDAYNFRRARRFVRSHSCMLQC